MIEIILVDLPPPGDRDRESCRRPDVDPAWARAGAPAGAADALGVAGTPRAVLGLGDEGGVFLLLCTQGERGDVEGGADGSSYKSSAAAEVASSLVIASLRPGTEFVLQQVAARTADRIHAQCVTPAAVVRQLQEFSTQTSRTNVPPNRPRAAPTAEAALRSLFCGTESWLDAIVSARVPRHVTQGADHGVRLDHVRAGDWRRTGVAVDECRRGYCCIARADHSIAATHGPWLRVSEESGKARTAEEDVPTRLQRPWSNPGRSSQPLDTW